jgi:hypothetical protein
MSKEKEILEGCAVDRHCDGPCASLHKRKYNPKTKEVDTCPAYYRYYVEKRKIETENRFKKKKEKWVKVELR